MKMKIFLQICVLSLAAVLTGCGLSRGVPAESDTEKEALEAYRELLSAAPALEGDHKELADASFDYEQNLARFGDHYDLFSIYDLDQDGIPELIALSTVNFRWTPVSVFTYADSEAVLMKSPAEPEAHGTFEQMSTANGSYITYICGANHIHSVWRGTTPTGEEAEENHAYALAGTTFTAIDCSADESENSAFFYDIALANTEENRAALVP